MVLLIKEIWNGLWRSRTILLASERMTTSWAILAASWRRKTAEEEKSMPFEAGFRGQQAVAWQKSSHMTEAGVNFREWVSPGCQRKHAQALCQIWKKRLGKTEKESYTVGTQQSHVSVGPSETVKMRRVSEKSKSHFPPPPMAIIIPSFSTSSNKSAFLGEWTPGHVIDRPSWRNF